MLKLEMGLFVAIAQQFRSQSIDNVLNPADFKTHCSVQDWCMRLRDSAAEESVNWSHDICNCLQNLCFNFLMMKVRISWLE